MTEPTATFTTEGHTPVLIEDWLPIRELGIESVRESAPIPGQFPKLKTLHLWWARAPLAASNGVVLTSLLPIWSDNLLDEVEGIREALDRVRSNRRDLSDSAGEMTPSDWYRVWVLWLCGIWGEPVAAQERIRVASLHGKVLGAKAYGYKPAFRNSPSVADLNVLHRLLVKRWGRMPRLLDPTAGGGSIPYTSLRYGVSTYANDLNPVAVGVLDAALRATTQYGLGLIPDLKRWGGLLVDRLESRLSPFFEKPDDAISNSYLYANTVACPRTGGPIPLSPNWWLDKSGGGVAAKPVPVRGADGTPSRIEFQVEQGSGISFDPDEGTVAGGVAVSPWDGLVVDGEHIKEEAQAGRMWPTLYAVACGKPKAKGTGLVRYFRSPSQVDSSALDAAEAELRRCMPEWQANGILPSELIGVSNYDRGHRLYGMYAWRDMFTPRQQLVHGAFIEEWRRLLPEVVDALGEDRGGEVMTILALMQGKTVTFNSRLTPWVPQRTMLSNVFDRHSFSFKWTHGEFEGSNELYPWALSQIINAYTGVAELLQPSRIGDILESEELTHSVPGDVTLSSGSAASLPHLGDGSVECVNIDPPFPMHFSCCVLPCCNYNGETEWTPRPTHHGTCIRFSGLDGPSRRSRRTCWRAGKTSMPLRSPSASRMVNRSS